MPPLGVIGIFSPEEIGRKRMQWRMMTRRDLLTLDVGVRHEMRIVDWGLTLAALFVLAVVQLAYGADYAREQKWADEITPRLVVGDPVYLEGRAGRKFLTIHTEASNAKAGLVIVHGMGVHPDWGLISVLRGALADHGYTTHRRRCRSWRKRPGPKSTARPSAKPVRG